jgi:gamma-butyrobetaine dioxygenase
MWGIFMEITDRILQLMADRGASAYFGERVSQQEHALQAAYLAEQSGAAEALVVAALLHDVGHLLSGLPENLASTGVDGRHEDAGETWLAAYFGPEVTEPVKLHVAAKRYLCAKDPDYAAALSPASVESLRLQGGPLSKEEVQQFERNPYFRDAVALRRWDDAAKEVGLEVPGLEQYRSHLERVRMR